MIGKFKRQSCYGWVHLSSSGFSLHFFPTTSAQNILNKTRGCRNIISAQRTACRDLRLPLPLLGTGMWPPLMGTAVPVGGTSSRSRVQSWDPQGPSRLGCMSLGATNPRWPQLPLHLFQAAGVKAICPAARDAWKAPEPFNYTIINVFGLFILLRLTSTFGIRQSRALIAWHRGCCPGLLPTTDRREQKQRKGVRGCGSVLELPALPRLCCCTATPLGSGLALLLPGFLLHSNNLPQNEP